MAPPDDSGQTDRAGPIAWTVEDYEFVRYLWDQAREAAVYDKYFGTVADSLLRRNRMAEITVAVTAPSSVISGWALWNWSVPAFAFAGVHVPELALGHFCWIALGALASAIAVAKPIWRPDQAIATYSKLYSEYRAINRAYGALVRTVQREGTSNDDVDERYQRLEDRIAAADQLRPPKLDESLREKCKGEVMSEMPATSLWAPKVPGIHPTLRGSVS